jgi:polyribonucleotide nucleotidyltransferase
MEGADIDLIVAGTASDVLMVEGELKEVGEAEMIEGIKKAHEAIKDQCRVINELAAEVPKSHTKRTYNHEENDAELEKAIYDATFQKYYDIAIHASAKEVRSEAFNKVKEDFVATLTDEQKAKKAMLARYFKKAQKAGVRNGWCWKKASAWTAARPIRSAPSGAKWTCCPAPTAVPSSPAARPRPSTW